MINESIDKPLTTAKTIVVGTLILFIAFFVGVYGISVFVDLPSSESVKTQVENFIPTDSFTLMNAPNSLVVSTYNNTWLSFDGIDDYANSTYNTWQNMMTFSFWFKRNNISDDNTVFSTYAPCEIILRLGGDGTVKWYPNTTDSVTWNAVANQSNLWSHAFIIHNRTGNTSALYLDGRYIGKDTTLTADICTTNNLYLGKRISTNQDFLNASLDDVIIYNYTMSGALAKRMWRESPKGGNWGSSIVSISYHSIKDPADDDTEVLPLSFSNQLDYLYRAGFHTITFDQYYAWRNGNYNLPTKPILITFDDGDQTIYDVAYPNMTAYGFVGIVAIPTDRPNRTAGYMNWTHLQILKNAGWQIASHSINGTELLSMPPTLWERVFNQSKWELDGNITGQNTTYWVYPGNANNFTTDSLCAKYYIMCSGTSGNPEWQDGTSNKFVYKYANLTHEENVNNNSIGRFTVRNTTSLVTFASEIDYDYNKRLHYRFNENSGTTVYDSSGYSNHGTIIGSRFTNDGITITLAENADYTRPTSTLFYLSSPLTYSNITASYSFMYGTDQEINIANNFSTGGARFFSLLVTVFTICGALIVVGAVYLIVQKVREQL